MGRASRAGRCVVALAVLGAVSSAMARSKAADGKPSALIRDGESEYAFQHGKLEYSRGDYANAEAEFRKDVVVNDKDAEAHYYLGLALSGESKTDDAIAEFDKAVAVDPTLVEAHAGKVDAMIAAKRFDDARAEVAIVRDQGRTATADLLEGRVLYAEGKYDEANKAFGRAKAAGGVEASSAAMYQGLTEMRLGRTSAARAAFRDVLDRDASLAAASRQLESTLGPTKKPWSVSLSLGYEYDSNVALLTDGAALPGNISHRADGRFVVQPHASYSFIQNARWDVGIDTSEYFAWQNRVSDFDLASYDVGTYANYRVIENGDLYASLRYDFNDVELGHDPFLKRNLVTPQVTYIERNFGFTTAYGQYDVRQFDMGSGALDRDGHYYAAGILQSIDLPELFKGIGKNRLEVSGRYEHQDTKGSDFDGNIYSAGVTVYGALPLWKLQADAGISVSYEGYANGNSLAADHRVRHDFEYRPSVGVSREICPNATVRVDYSYTNHDSNVAVYEYDRHVVGVSLILTY
jgi:tetratricopeptide (TPR) repeat protein